MKKMLLFNFPKEESGDTLVYDLIRNFDLRVNILRANIDFNANGFLLVEVEGDQETIRKSMHYAKEANVKVRSIESAILINKEKCVNCGACTAVCAVDALYLDETANLQFDKDKCLDCKLCVSACPTRAIDAIL